MYTNGQPAILASSLPVGSLDLADPKTPMVACTRCGRWAVLKRTIALPHTDPTSGKGCIGTGQRYRLDVRPAEVTAAVRDATEDAAQRRASHARPEPDEHADKPAVAYLGRPRTPRRSQTTGWTSTRSNTWTGANAYRRS
jgi:hypothetical protein